MIELFKLFGSIVVDNSEANKSIDNTTDKAEKSESKLLKVFGAIGAAVTAAFTADKIKDFGTAIVNMADDAQKALNSFSAATGEDMEAYESVLKSIYKNNYGESFEDIAASMATVKQQMGDISPEGLEELTTDALILRDTFDMEVNESMRAAKMLMDQFNISGKEAFNMIAQGAQNGLNKNDDLLDSINEYAVHYKQLGFTAENFFASLENGTAAGTFSVDKLGDAMKEFGIRAKDGSDSSREAFEILGLDADRMFALFNSGGAAAANMTQELVDKLAAMPDGVAKTTAGVGLFGTMFEDLGVDGIAALTKLESGISSTKDTLAQINKVKYNSLGDAMQGVQRTLETSLLVPLGEKIIPLLTKKLPEKLARIEEVGPKIVETFGNVVTKAQNLVTKVKGFVSPIVQEISGTVKSVASSIAENITPTLQNIGTWVTTTALPVVQSLWQGIQNGIAQIVPVISDAFGKIGEIFGSFMAIGQEVFGMIASKFGDVGSGVEKLMGIIKSFVEAYLNNMVENWRFFVDILQTSVVPIIGLVIDGLIGLASEIGENVLPMVQTFVQNVSEKFGGMAEFVCGLLQTILENIGPFFQTVQMLFQVLWDVCLTVWETIGQPIFDMVSYAVGRVAEVFAKNMPAIMEFVQTAVAGIKDTWENHLKPVFELIGTFIETILKPIFEVVFDAILGYVQVAFKTIASLWTEVLKPAFDGICDFIVNIFSGNWKGAWEGIVDTFETVFGGLEKVAKIPINAVIGLVNKAIDAINGLSFTVPDWVPGIGGEDFGFSIPKVPELAKGGVLERGQVGLLEGDGAEAVVPLERNTEWITRVAQQFNGVPGNNEVLERILDVLLEIRKALPEELADAVAQLKFEISNREFARLVKAVN